MLELVPTLLAQQTKPVAPPIQPIETSVQTQAKVSNPTPAPATPVATPEVIIPEAIVIRSTPLVTPAPLPEIPQSSPTPQVVTSPVALPPIPVQKQALPPSTSTDKPTASTHSIETTSPKPVEKSSSPVSPQPSPQTEAQSKGIEIPVPRPSPQSTVSTQKQLLEQRLADIVAKDRATQQTEQEAQTQTQQRDALVARAYNYATQRQYAQARKLLQNPTIPAELRSQVINNINALESASRPLGITQAKPPTVTKPQLTATKPTATKPVHPTRTIKPPAIFTGVPSISGTGRSQQTITIQVPQPSRSIARQSEPSTPIASDGAYIDQIGSSVQAENSKDLQAYNRNLPKLTSRDQLVYPLPDPVSVTSRFGWRRHPVTGVRRFHAGVDLGAGQGTPIIASRSGRVTAADRMGGYGLAVVMEQSDGKQDTLYAHMSQILVRPGQQIKAGTVIGRVGSTGLSTGPHLHYEARQKSNDGWTAIDPGTQLEAARIRLVQARQINAQRPDPNLQSALPSSNRGV